MKHIKQILLIALTAFFAGQIAAEEEQAAIKPLQIAPDANGVDLLTGKYRPQLPMLSIPADPNLSLHTLQQFDSKIMGTWYKKPTVCQDGSFPIICLGQIQRTETYNLTFGGSVSEGFKCLSFVCQPTNTTGSKLTGNMNPENQNYLYTQGSTGIQVRYNLVSSYFDDPCSSGYTDICATGTWYASLIKFPDGENLTITYDTAENTGVNTLYRPTKVTSNRGYEMHITYLSNDLTTGSGGWSKLASAYISKSTSPSVPLAKMTYNNSTNNYTDLLGRSWKYTGFNNAMGDEEGVSSYTMRLPGDSSNSTTVSAAGIVYNGQTYHEFATSVAKNGVIYSYSYTGVNRDPTTLELKYSKVIVTDALGHKRTLDLSTVAPSRLAITADTDAFGKKTSYEYTQGNRIKKVTYPGGNSIEFTYDVFGNVTQKRSNAKPGSPLSDIVVSANYPSESVCYKLGCFRPTSMIDANGNTTDYTFDPETGYLLTKLEPVGANGKRRLTTNTYATVNGFVRLQKTSVCATTECGTENEQIKEYTYWGNTDLPWTVKATNGAGTLSAITTYSYDNANASAGDSDGAGYVTMIDGPLSGTGDATYYRYDTAGRKTWEIGALNAKGYRVANRYTYRAQDSQVLTTETGTLTSPTDTNLIVYLKNVNIYDSKGLVANTQVIGDGVTQSYTQYSYDSLNRVECQTARMNPAIYASLWRSACYLETEGDFGPDRIVKNYYDAKSRITKTISGYGTPEAGIDIEMAYTDNGQVSLRKDGNGNVTNYLYDGFDRLERITFPDGTYEANTYDANSSLKTWRKRDGKTLTHNYDATGLTTNTYVPGESTITYHYDGLGRQSQAIRGSSYIYTSYDGLSRTKTVNNTGKTLTYTYDIASRRTQLKHPDNFYVNYTYDYTGALTSIIENTSVTLATYTYTNLGQLDKIARGSTGTASTYTYDAPGRVKSINQTNVVFTNFNYNPASQIISRAVSNDDYQIDVPYVGDTDYTPNVLNQYTKVGTKTLTYDTNGNLKSFDGWTYAYNAHNRMTSASKSGTSLTLDYDAAGTLQSSTLNGTKTTFLYDGNELIAEYNSSGTLLNRYVHGIGNDDPLVSYAGSGTTNKRYLIADERGSIIAETSTSGGILTKHQYGPFGEPVDVNAARFRYTGQILIPGTELYYYKARVYHPELGRFMQTDPIGYKDGMNWYAYGGNDPLTNVDSNGTSVDSFLSNTRYMVSSGLISQADYWNAVTSYGAGGTIGLAGVSLGTVFVAEGIVAGTLATADILAFEATGGTGLGAYATAKVAIATVEAEASLVAKEVKDLKPTLIQENPRNLIPTQTKSEMSGSQVKRLTKDMKQNGYDQSKPVDAWRNPETGRLEIQDGHHRTEAAKKAGLDKIPVQVWE